jgi:exodeoxyribonuclease V alpha subunit
MLDQTEYADEWKRKRAWYDKWFPGQLVTTEEGPHLSKAAAELIAKLSA